MQASCTTCRVLRVCDVTVTAVPGTVATSTSTKTGQTKQNIVEAHKTVCFLLIRGTTELKCREKKFNVTSLGANPLATPVRARSPDTLRLTTEIMGLS